MQAFSQRTTLSAAAKAASTSRVLFPLPSADCSAPAPSHSLRALQPNVRAGRARSLVLAKGVAREILARPEVEGDVLAFLDVSEAYLKALRNQKHQPDKKGPTVVKYGEGSLGAPAEFDVVICGGTLGLFLATSLQTRGYKVAIVEKRLIQGRNQEWNISRGELQILLDLDLMSPAELESCIVSEFNPIRVGFLGGEDIWVRDCLNLGVQPRLLLDILRRKFVAAGGAIYENTAFKGATILEDGIRMKLGPGGREAAVSVGDTNRPNGLGDANVPSSGGLGARPRPPELTCRLLLDCMGHYSDIVKQIRGRVKPDGMCMVVGSCAEGFAPENNVSADLLYSLTHAASDMQLFWEAFPAEGGTARTTYMFAYTDAHPDRASFENLLDTYFELLPQYQGEELEDLRFKRILFGGFPCYNNGPLPPAFDRVMQIGDASAAQSPLSFGGFGSMMRHLGRLTRAVGQALTDNRLSRSDLNWIQPYQPSLAASWLFQRSMSIGVGQCTYPAGAQPLKRSQGALMSRDEFGNPRNWGAPADPSKSPRLSPIARPYTRLTAAAQPNADGSVFSPTAFPALLAVMTRAKPLANQFAPYTPTRGRQFGAGAADPDEYLRWADEDPMATMATTSATPRDVGEEIAKAAGLPPPKASARKDIFEMDYRDMPEWAKLPHTHVNDILGTNFSVMKILGDRVLRPFLQDTIQLVPLSLSMTGMMLKNPIVISRVFLQVGPQTLGMWFVHYTMLIVYTLTYLALKPLRGTIPSYDFQRLLDALEYGSGMDHVYHPPSPPTAIEEQQKQLERQRELQQAGATGMLALPGVQQQQQLGAPLPSASAMQARETVSTTSGGGPNYRG